ncbi:T9SS type A sorting domain-containing protein [Algibacter pectinivorans]|uniref:Por secretion system C-terminal sorting domain-containing protein n=1 Tax=Algibacter pectinivorans TaxID=870482 RepID=A0A1I1QPZ2_9FLAO|nr:T9SS type A sorting domain-containing protein [Algibacter pectinivorans]SFD24119.1 Por secretion system C-terminal sorting domain-containing protein [Algibacter pectinivorans]
MKTKVIILSLLISYLGNSQAIDKFSIDSGGGLASADGIQMVYTIGEVNVQELRVNSMLLSEGFINGDMEQIALSSNNLEFESDFKIYPNPASDIINIKSSHPIDTVYIYNLLGKKVLSVNNTNRVVVNGLPVGIYLINIHYNSSMITEKIIIK